MIAVLLALALVSPAEYDAAEPGEVPWFRHPDGPEANGQDT